MAASRMGKTSQSSIAGRAATSVDFAHGHLHVSRLKGSAESVHPLSGRELRALRRLKRDQDPASPFMLPE